MDKNKQIVEKLKKLFDILNPSDPYYNLMGVRIDLECFGCDKICLETIKRVED